MNKVSSGKKGEEQAAAALESAGMKIIAKNVRSKEGEVDIVALDGETVVFVEVKAWSVYGMEDLQYGINAQKQQKIIKTANYFLSENRKYSNMAIRFDVVFINKNSVTHLASAFTERVL
ncbi:MAG: YraN family protein [Treponema sp.]|jgi:putative endonuclease|nr:YraN family protein [Treponema sp.]